eukprot:82364_1
MSSKQFIDKAKQFKVSPQDAGTLFKKIKQYFKNVTTSSQLQKQYFKNVVVQKAMTISDTQTMLLIEDIKEEKEAVKAKETTISHTFLNTAHSTKIKRKKKGDFFYHRLSTVNEEMKQESKVTADYFDERKDERKDAWLTTEITVEDVNVMEQHFTIEGWLTTFWKESNISVETLLKKLLGFKKNVDTDTFFKKNDIYIRDIEDYRGS